MFLHVGNVHSSVIPRHDQSEALDARLTDAGEALYRHARIVLDAVKEAEASIRRSDDAVREAHKI